jgi:hypothetical protein
LNSQAEASRRPADAVVQAEQLESGHGCSRDEHRREMHRIESSNRPAWKRLSRAFDNLRADPQDVPMRGSCRQMGPSVRRVRFRQLAQRGRAEQYAIALDEA